MGLTQSTPPTTEPLTLTEAKAHCRIDHTDDDTLLGLYIGAARADVETFTGRQLVTATWDYTLAAFPASRCLVLPRPPLASVTHIKYLDSNGDTQTVSADDYTVFTDTEPGYVELDHGESWPSTYSASNAVQIRFIAGYGVESVVPDLLKAALGLLVEHLYENREPVAIGVAVASIPLTVEHILWQYRIKGVG